MSDGSGRITLNDEFVAATLRSLDASRPQNDPVNHPAHYAAHPSGVECITVAEHFGFNLGNALKYIWRADAKGAPVQDLEKARWYLDREIARRKGGHGA